MSVSPFRIAVTDEALEDLRLRLERPRWSDAHDLGMGWSAGSDGPFMRRLAEHWRERYDWRAHEARLNALTQALVEVDGYRIHVVHVRSPRRPAIPLVLTHGWPGSFVEFLELIRILRTDEGPSFDLIVPSIPGFGYSTRPRATSTRDVAQLWLALMTELGYERFALQGGDFGAGISSWAARLAPARVIALHLNFLSGSFRPWLGEGAAPLSDEEQRLLAHIAAWSDREGAYSHLQRTKPRTPAFALSDSPIGLAAWIVEKFQAWSGCREDEDPPFALDELLTNVALYWFSGSIGSAIALYHDSAPHPLALERGELIVPPLAFAAFPHEIAVPPPSWLARGYDLQRYTAMPRGGHFAALQAPADLAADIRAFFTELGERGS